MSPRNSDSDTDPDPDRAAKLLGQSFPRALRETRVLDFSSGIAGAYCSKLFADAGAEVIKVETDAGDPLRRWSASGADLAGTDAPLFQFLHFSKRAVVLAPGSPAVAAALGDADVVIEGPDAAWFDAATVSRQLPGLVLVSISPWGRTGPWAERPASDFTLQAESGSIGSRGVPGGEPFALGGRTGEFLAGSFAAAAAMAALRRVGRGGAGEWIDLSLLETLALGTTNFMSVLWQMLELPAALHGPLMPTVETPSIEPTSDGFVGFCTNSRQQFADFLLLIERPELQSDEMLAQIAGRLARFDEWQAMVREWTLTHTTDAIVERATALRIPVAPVLDGDRVRRHPQVVARGVYRQAPDGGFEYPRPPYRIAGVELAAQAPAPRLGEHGNRIAARRRPSRSQQPRNGGLPLAGIRILDLTNWWAGPICTQLLAALGAEVIHVESPRKPDGMRMIGGMLAARHERWWECSQFFLPANAGKKSLTLHLADRRGLELLGRLIEQADALVENFTPRVLDSFGLSWEWVQARNPRCVMVRMPAFGLDGPWRDAPGFAQTMEQLSGLAWVTGHADDQPRIQRGPCDPMAGMHAAFALLLALAERDLRGHGFLVEATMLEAALNAAAEQVVEFTAHGRLLQRAGNRAPHAAPQGLYACRVGAEPAWLAVAIETDAQWRALCATVAVPADWHGDHRLATLAGRQQRHDEIDALLRTLFADQDRDALVETLVARRIPAAAVVAPTAIHLHPQMVARGFFAAPPHAVVGTVAIPGLPFRCRSIDELVRGAAPTMGADNGEILGGWLGLSADELASLEADGVIGTRPTGL